MKHVYAVSIGLILIGCAPQELPQGLSGGRTVGEPIAQSEEEVDYVFESSALPTDVEMAAPNPEFHSFQDPAPVDSQVRILLTGQPHPIADAVQMSFERVSVQLANGHWVSVEAGLQAHEINDLAGGGTAVLGQVSLPSVGVQCVQMFVRAAHVSIRGEQRDVFVPNDGLVQVPLSAELESGLETTVVYELDAARVVEETPKGLALRFPLLKLNGLSQASF